LSKSVSERSSSWFVDDTQNVEAGNLASFLGCLTLCVVEVSRDGDDSFSDSVAKVRLSIALELHQDTRRTDLLWVYSLPSMPMVQSVPMWRFTERDGAVDVGDGLALGDLADKDLAVLGECDDRWCGASSFGVGDNCCFAAFEYGYAAIGGS
jgi:hypothetical protein